MNNFICLIVLAFFIASAVEARKSHRHKIFMKLDIADSAEKWYKNNRKIVCWNRYYAKKIKLEKIFWIIKKSIQTRAQQKIRNKGTIILHLANNDNAGNSSANATAGNASAPVANASAANGSNSSKPTFNLFEGDKVKNKK